MPNRGDLDDELVLDPTALVGISGFEFHGFQVAWKLDELRTLGELRSEQL